ncbi:MAG: hypothetical protein AAF558_05675 [Verrucomicrobiota bacterium]
MSAFVLAVFVIGLIAAPTKKHEIFPFFCWFLFSKTPETTINHVIVLTHFDGKPIIPPQPFMESPLIERFEAGTNAHRVIQALGTAIENQDQKEMIRHRNMIEESYFKGPTTYEVRKRIYDPLTYYKKRTSEELILGIFGSEEPLP